MNKGSPARMPAPFLAIQTYWKSFIAKSRSAGRHTIRDCRAGYR
jgi:hypothetical protein